MTEPREYALGESEREPSLSHKAPDEFRRRHLAEWYPEPWVQLAHETWDAYDREATDREIPGGPVPRFNRFGLPSPIKSFGQLFRWRCGNAYPQALAGGFTGTERDWQQEVKRRGR